MRHLQKIFGGANPKPRAHAQQRHLGLRSLDRGGHAGVGPSVELHRNGCFPATVGFASASQQSQGPGRVAPAAPSWGLSSLVGRGLKGFGKTGAGGACTPHPGVAGASCPHVTPSGRWHPPGARSVPPRRSSPWEGCCPPPAPLQRAGSNQSAALPPDCLVRSNDL